MGMVINFPERPRTLREGGLGDHRSEAATIIILPVIRIERAPDPSDGIEPHSDTPGGKRRRRSS